MSQASEEEFEPVSVTKRDLELLEPYEGKLSSTVLRGERGSNAPDLPDNGA
jgi:hypothetical protein